MFRFFTVVFFLIWASATSQDRLLDSESEHLLGLIDTTAIEALTLDDTLFLIQRPKVLNSGVKIVDKRLTDIDLESKLVYLDKQTPIELQANHLVMREVENYLAASDRQLAKWMGAGAYYFPLFEEVLYRNNLPLELKFLPVLESGLRPRVESRSGARGLWQLMYGTAKENGLKMSSYVDERTDPILSTQAACNYLKKMHRLYGDWLLALAAYNAGPGNINKAISRSGGKRNYWEIRAYLPQETRDYIPRFIAINYLFNSQIEHSIGQIQPKIFYQQVDTVVVNRNIPLRLIAEHLAIEFEQLKFINPAYTYDIIPGTSMDRYPLRLPMNKLSDWQSKKQELYQRLDTLEAEKKVVYPKFEEQLYRKVYRVASGDYLGKIAEKFKVKVSHIKKWNSLKSNKLKIGQTLIIFKN
ncbi:MAG: transglycosylase SLT domain-containing protein [Flavobacteriales bacterium]